MTDTKKHLWEIEHPYYCNEGNFFAQESCESRYRSFSEFLNEEGGSDMDYNLLFRWDWVEDEYNGDVNYRNGRLKLFWMGQRKGLYRWSIVEVCRGDEDAVRAFLDARYSYLKSLWEPLQ